MIGKYRDIGVKLFLTDFSLDTGIPSVGALAYDPSTFPEKSEIVWTAGTTPDPQKALSRALTEVAQLAGDFNSSSNYVASGLPKFNDLAEADYVIHPGSTVSISDLPDLSHENIKIEVENCISALSRIGMDVILINTTHQKLEDPRLLYDHSRRSFQGKGCGNKRGHVLGQIDSRKRRSGMGLQ